MNFNSSNLADFNNWYQLVNVICIESANLPSIDLLCLHVRDKIREEDKSPDSKTLCLITRYFAIYYILLSWNTTVWYRLSDKQKSRNRGSRKKGRIIFGISRSTRSWTVCLTVNHPSTKENSRALLRFYLRFILVLLIIVRWQLAFFYEFTCTLPFTWFTCHLCILISDRRLIFVAGNQRFAARSHNKCYLRFWCNSRNRQRIFCFSIKNSTKNTWMQRNCLY